jgi:hypothetical protein
VALPLMFASYQLLVRYSFIGGVLNGHRARRNAAVRLQPQSPPSPPLAIGQETLG